MSMAIKVAFNLMKIVDISEDSKRKEVPRLGSKRKEPVRVAVAFAFSVFNRKRVGSRFQSCSWRTRRKGSSRQLSCEYL